MSLLLLKDDRATGRIVVTVSAPEDEALEGIRCPLCGWRPSASSYWNCDWVDTPEPFFESCGTVWNTFLTGGRCPGCRHQWQWTSCHECEEWSLHDDWYERPGGRR
jgi:DNA-directed RNA polymerase subunit RPC12/RpoP